MSMRDLVRMVGRQRGACRSQSWRRGIPPCGRKLERSLLRLRGRLHNPSLGATVWSSQMTSLVGSFLLSDSLDSSGVVGQEENALTGYQFQSRYQSVTEEARLVRNDVSLEQGIGDGGWEPSCQRPQPRLTSWALHCRVMMRHWNQVVGVSGKIQLFNPASSCKRLTVNGEKEGAHAGLSNSGQVLIRPIQGLELQCIMLACSYRFRDW